MRNCDALGARGIMTLQPNVGDLLTHHSYEGVLMLVVDKRIGYDAKMHFELLSLAAPHLPAGTTGLFGIEFVMENFELVAEAQDV